MTKTPSSAAHAHWSKWPLRVTTTIATVMLFDQAVFAGQFLSGSFDQLHMHRENATFAGIAVLVSAAAAVLVWRPGRGPWWPILAHLGLFALIGVQIALGFARVINVHVPLGVATIILASAVAAWAWLRR